MKISGTGQVNKSQAASKRRGKKVAGRRFSVEKQAEARPSAPISGAGPLTAVDSLLGLQEVDRRDGSRAKGFKRGNDILDHLDEIRNGLLLGSISMGRLEAISKMVHSRREQIDDPRLADILDEIELRAEVELAKLRLS
ncbi:MAG: flagellar assembly protein FliX [Sphingomonadales bacterium]